MRKRPKQHQLEDLSRAKFQLCLPKNWVFRDKDKDYGIDGEVELFDENGNSQGLKFYVQLKATSSKTKSTILNVTFKIDTLNYFKQLDIPVLLARYSESEDVFYLRWINDVDLSFSRENAKTFRIKLNENIFWDDNTSFNLENTLSNIRLLKSGHFNFPISYSIHIYNDEIKGMSKRMLELELRNELMNFEDILEYKKNNDNSLFKINLTKERLLVQPSILAGTYFHGIKEIAEENFVYELTTSILLAFSTSLFQIGQADKAGRIIFDYELEKKLLEKEELLMILLPHLLKSSFLEATLKMINEGIDIQGKNFLLMPSLMILLLRLKVKGRKKKEILETFFKTRLEKTLATGIEPLIATAYYNLGNFYKNNGKYYDSFSCYIKAKKHDTNYLKRSYFYRELGGIFFEIDKFLTSSKFYKKALDLGAPRAIKKFYADALMFSGEYEKAFITFDEYLSESEEEKLDQIFVLKAILLKKVLNEKKILTQKRKPNEANQIADRASSIEILDKAFEKDLLSSLAWFNLGITQRDQKKFKHSTISFAMCAMINVWDVEAWVFAFFSFFNSGKEGDLILGSSILEAGYVQNGDEFLMAIYSVLEESDEDNDDLIDMIDNFFINHEGNNEGDKIIRVLGEEDYKEIDLNSNIESND